MSDLGLAGMIYEQKRPEPPQWFFDMGFPELLGAAQHQDQINSWPRWARWGHRLLVSWRCPACMFWNRR